MADRSPGGKEVDERTARIAIKRLRHERKVLEAQLEGLDINIDEMRDNIARREEQIIQTTARIEELRAKEKELEEAQNG